MQRLGATDELRRQKFEPAVSGSYAAFRLSRRDATSPPSTPRILMNNSLQSLVRWHLALVTVFLTQDMWWPAAPEIYFNIVKTCLAFGVAAMGFCIYFRIKASTRLGGLDGPS